MDKKSFEENSTSRLKPMALAIGITLLSACGGGTTGGGNIVSTGDGGIIGTTKVPKITSLSPLEAKSKSGLLQTTVINSHGKFNLKTTKAEAYLIRTKPSTAAKSRAARSSAYYYGIAHSDGKKLITRDIHPYTDLIVRNWFATQSLDIDHEFDKAGAISKLPSQAEINAIETEIEGIITPTLVDYEITGGVDLLAIPFEINNQGFDKFLNKNEVIIDNNDLVTINLTQKDGDDQGVGINQIPLSTDFTSNNDTPPTTPTGLVAAAKNNSAIELSWNASSDDKGVSSYHIFRNGSQISTSPYAAFTDSGLSTNTNYSYRVQAIDSRQQLSNQSAATTPIMLSGSDTSAVDGEYNVVVTSTSSGDNCGGATGSYTLANGTQLTGSVHNGSNTFVVNGTRNTDTGEVTGGYAFTSGQQYATFTGIIDENTSNGTYQDVYGCVGNWVAVKK